MAPSAVAVDDPLRSVSTPWKDHLKIFPSVITSEAIVEPTPPLTVDQLIRQRSKEGLSHAIVSYPSSGIEYVNYTYRQLDIFAARVAQKYAVVIPQRTSSSDPERVVGLLGLSNFDYLVSILALTKLGHTVLFLSTRISVAAYTSLLQTTGANHILVDQAFRDTISQVKEGLPNIEVHDIISSKTYDFAIADEDFHTQFDSQYDPEVESSKIAWIIHSSGSTGLPKPIFQTHRAALSNYASNLNLRGFITLPLYHAHGISSVFRAIHSRKQIYVYNASLPLTQQHLLGIMHRYDFQIFYGVPYALKILGETQEGVKALANLKVVMFGGSACPDALGDRLVENGVNLISHYGTTETGQLMTSFRPIDDKAWDYVRLPENYKRYISFEQRTPGIYELVALDGLPSKVASNRPDGSYATKDLFTPHPTIPDAWKYLARLDDTIVLMNGEKITPNAFEQSIRDSKLVSEAVLFGSGKSHIGMLIIPSQATVGLSSEELERLLAPALARANELVPAYAQLSLDMVNILPVGTAYPRTDKGTAIRAAFYKLFDREIEETYQRAEVSSGELSLSEPELREYIRKLLVKILSPSVSEILQDDTDFFSVGIDSLQAIQLRSAIGKNIQTNGQKLTPNIVFDFPTIQNLAQELFRLRTGGTTENVSTVAKMKALIAKYSVFESHFPIESINEGKYLVVTGATGSLGAHLTSQLVLQDDVKKVFCLVRAKSPEIAHLRVLHSMRERSVYHILPLFARKKIYAIPSDFSESDLGLGQTQYDLIASQITGLIHCAWSVNFNLGLGSFEYDCIAGTHNLISLCLKAQRPSPANFNFCSSVSAVAGTKGGFVPESLPESLEYAQNMGYAQSKLVTEHICVAAAKSYGVKTRVLRVGQVVADTVHGIWNASEAIPLMMQAGLTIGAIPQLDECPLWLPVDTVAAAVAEVSLSETDAKVFNIVNHNSFHWTRDLLPALHDAGLDFSELSQQEWVTLLRKSNPDPKTNPPIKLLEFFAKKYDNDKPRTGLVYDTSLARFISRSLASAPVLDQSLVNKFVAHFLKTSWTPASRSISQKRLIVLAGPCGAGKSTIAHAVAAHLKAPLIEGDDLHSIFSVAKMAACTPLSDDDRWLWLEMIKAKALLQLVEQGGDNIIVTFSALKRIYRDELRANRVLKPTFIVLQGTEGVLRQRVGVREGHFMSSEMVESPLGVLEQPGEEETDVVPIDVEKSKEVIIREVLSVLGEIICN